MGILTIDSEIIVPLPCMLAFMNLLLQTHPILYIVDEQFGDNDGHAVKVMFALHWQPNCSPAMPLYCEISIVC